MLKALLLTRDQEVLRVIRRVLETVTIDMETITSTDAARQAIGRRKFDAVLVDCDDVQSGCEVIRELRQGKSNAKAIVFAITNRITTTKDAFNLGANFILEKPIAPDRAARSLRAAHGLILRERRRYHRHQVKTTARVSYGSLRDVPVPMSNISEGGVALGAAPTADMKGVVHLRFELPGCNKFLEAKGEFVGSSNGGNHVGIRFTTMPPATKSELEAWLIRQLEAVAPGLINSAR